MAEGFIPLVRTTLSEEDANAARRAILSGWVTQGPEVAAFEKEFAAIVGASFACAVSSCTAALHLALRAVGIGPGDEVITASHSFIATANSIRYCGAIPVFADIDPSTCNLDPEKVEQSITSRTRAILCVHQMGMVCDLPALLDIARSHSLPLIEDAACAHGSEINVAGEWEPIGKPRGDVACFSFHPRKLVAAGEGGMLTTSNPEWDRRFRLWRQHGMSVSDVARHSAAEVAFESYTELGYNYRLSDIHAAVGRRQLQQLGEAIAARRRLATRYGTLLCGIPGLTLPQEPSWARSNWQSYWVRLPAHCDQRSVMQFLLDRGIASRRGIMCAHLEPAYSEQPWIAGAGGLRESELARDSTILLPIFPSMTEREHETVASALRKAVESHACRS